MSSFSRLLRQFRGTVPAEVVAAGANLAVVELQIFENGGRSPSESLARRILRQGYGLTEHDTDRAVLGVRLLDLGLTDPDLRQLVIDLILGDTPAPDREAIRQRYRDYTAAFKPRPDPKPPRRAGR